MKKNIESKNSLGKNGMVEKMMFNPKFYNYGNIQNAFYA